MSISPFNPGTSFLKKLLLVAVILLLLAGGTWFFLRRYLKSPDLSRQLNDRITQLVQEKSGGRYRLSIGDIHLDPTQRSATLRNIELVPDTSLLRSGQRISLRLSNLLIKNVDITALLSQQAVRLNTITVAGGEVLVESLGREKSDSAAAPAGVKEGREKLVRSVRKNLNSIGVDTLQLDGIDLVYLNRRKEKKTVRKIHIDLYDIAIDSAALRDSTRLFFARALRVSIDSLRLPVSDNRYLLSARKLIVSAGKQNLTHISGLKLEAQPAQSLEAAAAKAGVQKDIYRLTVKEITATEPGFTDLLEDSLIRAASVLISDADLQVFNDKSNPPATVSKVGQYPHQLLKRLPFALDIPVLAIENGRVSYSEKNEKGDAIGKLLFTRVRGKIGPLSGKGNGLLPFKAEMDAHFMDASAVAVTFGFPVSRDGRFSVKANFAPFPVTQLNPMAIPLGNTKLVTGKVNRLYFTVNGNNDAAIATTTLQYEGLQIEVLGGSPEQGYRKKGLLSFIANNFVLQENNRPGDRYPDQRRARYQRVTTKSFFNLVWKSVFYSVKSNTGVGKKGRDKERATLLP